MNWAREKLEIFFSDLALNSVMLMLLAVSCLATWSGLSDFMAAQGDTNIISGLSTQAFVGLIVIILTIAMFVALREVLAPKRLLNWVPAILLYLVLLIWSVGFGYGFWWSLLAGNDATDQGIRRAMSTVEMQAVTVQADISAISSQIDNAVRLSRLKAEQEEAQGGTCGVASLAGNGRFLRARRETQSEIAALSQTIKGDWLGPLDEQIRGLSEAFDNNYASATGSEDRRRAFQKTYNDLQKTASYISSSARAQGLAYAAQLRNKARRLSEAPDFGAQPYCYDPDLAATLVLVAERLERSFEVNVPPIRFSDGTEGVARAVEDLWLGLARYVLRRDFSPPDTGTRPILSGGRAITAMLAAVAVDLAIFVFAIFQSGRSLPDPTFRAQHVRPTVAKDHEPDSGETIVETDTAPIAFSDPSFEAVEARRLVSGPITDAEMEPQEEPGPEPDEFVDDDYEEAGFADLNLPAELMREIEDRISKFDFAHQDYLSAADATRRRDGSKAMKQRLKELSQRDVSQIGYEGRLAGEDCIKVEKRAVDGEPGVILEVLEFGFRHKRAGLIRPAKVIIVDDT